MDTAQLLNDRAQDNIRDTSKLETKMDVEPSAAAKSSALHAAGKDIDGQLLNEREFYAEMEKKLMGRVMSEIAEIAAQNNTSWAHKQGKVPFERAD